eukprot:5361580-Pleurochrysis_carterae.AAC.1
MHTRVFLAVQRIAAAGTGSGEVGPRRMIDCAARSVAASRGGCLSAVALTSAEVAVDVWWKKARGT